MSEFKIDFDWEFHAPQWVDLLQEEDQNADAWFGTAEARITENTKRLRRPKRWTLPSQSPKSLKALRGESSIRKLEGKRSLVVTPEEQVPPPTKPEKETHRAEKKKNGHDILMGFRMFGLW